MSATAALTALPGHRDVPERQPVHELRDDLDIYPGAPGPGGAPTWILHDPLRNKFFTLGWLEYELLGRWDRSDPDVIAHQVCAQTTLDAGAEDVRFLDAFLLRNQLVRADSREESRALLAGFLAAKPKFWSFVLHRYLFFRLPLLRPDRFLGATLPLARPFFSRAFRRLLLLVGVIGGFLAIRQWSVFGQTLEHFLSGQGLVYFLLALVVSKCLHELGHAYTCKYYGLRVPTMGLAFLVMWPFLYTDTTESWKLASRRQRLAIGGAGMFAELSLAVFATLAWSFLPDGGLRSAVFFLATASWMMTLLININPFMRWDGYYILSDLLGIQNLQARAFALARWRLRESLFGFGDPPTEVFDTRMRRILLAYAYCTWIYRFILFLAIALLVYYFFFKLLGLMLMAVELIWFIGRPIYAEIAEWRNKRGVLTWNRHTITTLGCVIFTVLVLIFPWQHHLDAPGVLQPGLYKTFHSPAPARLTRVHVRNNQSVPAAAPLFDLYSPALAFQLAEIENQITLYTASLARQGSKDILEQRDILRRRLNEARVARRGLVDQISRLTVRAPFAGQMVMTAEHLAPGLWLSEDLELGTLVDKGTLEVIAYVTENDLPRVRIHAPGYFYPENPRLEPVGVTVRDIDHTGAASLTEPVLAAANGGSIPTRETRDGELAPRHALYRIRMQIDEPEQATADTVLRGTVHIKAESESWLKKIWMQISGVLIRESSF